MNERQLFERYAPGVAYIIVENRAGDQKTGTCFHVGDQVFITARHVIDSPDDPLTIVKIATTNAGIRETTPGNYVATYSARETQNIEGPYFHPKPEYDLAALRLPELNAAQIPLLPLLSDRFENKLLLRKVIVLGFPRVPGSSGPVLVCARAEVSASFTTYFDDQPLYIVSSLARGGFSGGPAITTPRHCLGVITRSMVTQDRPEELGFMAVIPPFPILEMLDHNGIMPSYLRREIWEPYQRMSEGGAAPSYFE